jgi:hypothetical protein
VIRIKRKTAAQQLGPRNNLKNKNKNKMRKPKTLLKRRLIYFAVLFLLVYTAFSRLSWADTLPNLSDRLSNSDVSASARHTISLTFSDNLIADDYIEVNMPASFGNILQANIICPGTMGNTAPTVHSARCTATEAFNASSTSIIINSVANPASEGSYNISVFTYNNTGSAVYENAVTVVAIVNNIDVRASVPSAMTFTVTGLATTTNINGDETTGSSSPATLAFGTLGIGTSSILGHGLAVETNSRYGYAVTVQEDQDLTNTNGSDIDTFRDGTIAGPQTWANPTGTLDVENTYGHMGITTQDDSLSGGDTFGNALYQGLSSTTASEVMYHTGPADGSTESKGYTRVGYRVEISALQEAGDYQNTLTYIATPIF